MISVFITLLNAHFIGTMQLWTAILAYQKLSWRGALMTAATESVPNTAAV